MDIIAHEALTPEAERLLERFPDAKPFIHGDEDLPDADWPLPSSEALEYLDKAAILLSKRGVDAAAGDPEHSRPPQIDGGTPWGDSGALSTIRHAHKKRGRTEMERTRAEWQ